ncbi:MAG: hypothetical protein IH946_06075 [Bacteroidetes bacterium]|nr:hypothetical protein [Bacteroidota bacterium]
MKTLLKRLEEFEHATTESKVAEMAYETKGRMTAKIDELMKEVDPYQIDGFMQRLKVCKDNVNAQERDY